MARVHEMEAQVRLKDEILKDLEAAVFLNSGFDACFNIFQPCNFLNKCSQ